MPHSCSALGSPLLLVHLYSACDTTESAGAHFAVPSSIHLQCRTEQRPLQGHSIVIPLRKKHNSVNNLPYPALASAECISPSFPLHLPLYIHITYPHDQSHSHSTSTEVHISIPAAWRRSFNALYAVGIRQSRGNGRTCRGKGGSRGHVRGCDPPKTPRQSHRWVIDSSGPAPLVSTSRCVTTHMTTHMTMHRGHLRFLSYILVVLSLAQNC